MRKPSFQLLFLMAENKPRKAWALQGVFYINLRAITRTPASS